METFTLVVLLWAAWGEPWSMRLLGLGGGECIDRLLKTRRRV